MALMMRRAPKISVIGDVSIAVIGWSAGMASRVGTTPTLDESRTYHARQLETLPARLRTLEPAANPFDAEISAQLRSLARTIDAAIS